MTSYNLSVAASKRICSALYALVDKRKNMFCYQDVIECLGQENMSQPVDRYVDDLIVLLRDEDPSMATNIGLVCAEELAQSRRRERNVKEAWVMLSETLGGE